ncbi:unnamed protein product [Cuscuta campestris]|uniref:Uncharacterized protein n=1 Tax=Cuscuta campestris TaxID=132261 RepID=A0A484LWG1_9ASTE|nr:unnamed protein product [Cuscuta campestris]
MTTERQKISVPFIWEERPGIPNKDWKPRDHKPSNTLKFVPTIKLIPSIPFNWEDKPGRPLPRFLLPFPPQFMGDSGFITRKPGATLGELMMMSQRRSCPGKAKQKQKQSMTREQKFIGSAHGCCMFGGGENIGDLHTNWKRELKLLPKV